jgi:hypothetical protein
VVEGFWLQSGRLALYTRLLREGLMAELIKSYGEFWNPDVVQWGRRGRGNRGALLGEVKRDNKSMQIDFWNCKGIYVLYDSFSAIYVGKTVDRAMGKRIRDHLTDRHAGRWDMFSWYSVSAPRFTEGDVRAPGQGQYNPEQIIETLEALAILIADPRLNRKRESLSGAYEATQVGSAHPQTIRHYLETILSKLPGDEGQ